MDETPHCFIIQKTKKLYIEVFLHREANLDFNYNLTQFRGRQQRWRQQCKINKELNLLFNAISENLQQFYSYKTD